MCSKSRIHEPECQDGENRSSTEAPAPRVSKFFLVLRNLTDAEWGEKTKEKRCWAVNKSRVQGFPHLPAHGCEGILEPMPSETLFHQVQC